MPYDSIINRTNASDLIPQQVANGIIQNIAEKSVVLQMARKLPNMSSNTLKLNVLSSLASAYFVDGDTGLKQTTEMAWKNKYIVAEEIAAIVPIPVNVLEDSGYDLWAAVKPAIEEAFAVLIDRAVLLGENKPASWLDGIAVSAEAAGNSITIGDNGDLYDDILGDNGLYGMVEEDGFIVSGNIAQVRMKSRLRGLRATDGTPLYTPTPQEGTKYALDGEPLTFTKNGALLPEDGINLIAGDFSQLVYSIRNDIRFEIFNTGVIQDAAGKIKYNLLQQDMKALRAVMRLGWQIPNPVSRANADDATRYPFAILKSV